ncbi:DNA cytosine methyltransferase [Azotobacter vinelandii]
MSDLITDFGLAGGPREAFDVLAAGLPCQAFARIGRSKLRSVTGDEDAFKNDPRASLYRRFLEIVDETRPLAILVENVPDIMNFGGHNVPEEIAEGLRVRGYVTRYTLLNAAFYGVPQLRERLFLVAVDATLDVIPQFPSPTHFMELPRGYESSRAVALKHVKDVGSHFSPIPSPAGGLPSSIGTESALADLPFISDHLRDTAIIRKRKVADKLPYREGITPSTYAHLMRDWPGFSASEKCERQCRAHYHA